MKLASLIVQVLFDPGAVVRLASVISAVIVTEVELIDRTRSVVVAKILTVAADPLACKN